MRVVFDTNVFVSALVFPGGKGEAAVERVIDGRDQLLVSRAIVAGLLEVLARKFARDREELARVVVFVDAIAEVVDPRCAIDALADDADNRILECAVEGRADRIVTGDRAMLALGSYEGIGLVSLSGYLEGDD